MSCMQILARMRLSNHRSWQHFDLDISRDLAVMMVVQFRFVLAWDLGKWSLLSSLSFFSETVENK